MSPIKLKETTEKLLPHCCFPPLFIAINVTRPLKGPGYNTGGGIERHVVVRNLIDLILRNISAICTQVGNSTTEISLNGFYVPKLNDTSLG
jgi:hypothetical protein